MTAKKTCPCAELPPVLDRDTKKLPLRRLEELDHRTPIQLNPELGNYYLSHLMRCTSCGQLWQIDGQTKSGFRQLSWDALFIKIDSDTNWKSYDDTIARVNHLAQKHGGTSEKNCITAGCHGKALSDGVFCPSCMYERSLHR